jgi:hypothetical protein
MREIIGQLDHLRSRGRVFLVVQHACVLLACAAAVAIVIAAADFLLRFPAPFRGLLLACGVGAAAWAAWTRLLPAIGFRPSLTDVALRVERTVPQVRGRLASSVEFALEGAADRSVLAARSVRDAQSRLATVSLATVMDLRRTRRDVGAFAGVMLVLAVIVAVSPSFAGTAAMRVFAPWSGVEWPARTGVSSLMADVAIHPRGQALALRAQCTRAPGGRVDDQDISATYRLTVDGRTGPWREIMLTPQSAGVYERLVETDAERIEFWFESDDASTSRETIALEPPPAVLRAALSIDPPDYARRHVAPRDVELGSGTDERATVNEPALAGSDATLRLEFNKAIPMPSDAAGRRRWLADTFGWDASEPPPALAFDESPTASLTLRWRLDAPRTLAVSLVDEHRLTNVEDIVYRIEMVEDRPPSVTITQPASDQTVLPDAVVPLAVDARDDVSLAGVGFEARRGAKPGAPVTDVQTDPAAAAWEGADSAGATLAREFDLAPLHLVEGDIVEIIGTTEDLYDVDGARRGLVRSAPRRLRVISEREFGEALFQELKALRQNAIRLEGQQADLQDEVIDDGVQPGAARAQERIGERIAEHLDGVRRLQDRARANRFEDSQIEALMSQADDLLSHAGEASSRATEQIDQRAREARGEEEPDEQRDTPEDADAELRQPDEDDRPIVESQQEVREELRDLIEALDRNEDTWVMNQRIRDLLEQQTRLQGQTQSLNEQTRGRSLEELEPTELSELDRIAQQQRDLAAQLRDLVDALRERAEEMEPIDPQAAASQRRAADTAEQRGTDRRMESAAEQAARNQLQNAQNSQQQSRNDLEQMLQDLDRHRARAEELQRRMESLIQSIERLVVVQEEELAMLARAADAADFTGRDRAMIRLNQNTQATSGEARAAGNEAARVARSLDRAADAQGDAVGFLRASPVAPADAEQAETRSLELLREALEAAKELEEQAEQDAMQQRRDELKQAYADQMERQIALRGDTLGLAAGGELDRRGLVDARRFGNIEDEIRTALADLRTATQEISDSRIFSHTHDLMDGWAQSAADGLREGDVGPDVTDRQLAVAEALAQLIAALAEEQGDPNEFEDGAQQQPADGGGQGQSAPPALVPPIAELKLLRGLQEQIYNRTKALDTRTDLEEAGRRQRLRDLSREQQDLLDLGTEMLEQLAPPGANPPEGGPS